MKTQSAGASDRGQIRENNEDRFLIDETLGLYVVCDGVGGQSAGEVASERAVALAAEFIRPHREILKNASRKPDGYYRVLELAEDTAQKVSRRLYELAESDEQWFGMRTTMTLLLIVDSKGIMAHVGDSRLYLFRKGELHQLSSDHTFSNELVQAGNISEDDPMYEKYKNVLTRAVGQEKLVQVESLIFDLFPGDVCLLCSDGLSNYFSDDTKATEILHTHGLNEVCDGLIQFANSQGGADNITLVVVRFPEEANENHARDIQHQFKTLKSSFLCHNLSTSRLMRFLDLSRLLEYPAGREVLSADQSLDGMYIVLDGELSVEDDFESRDGLRAGNFLGESCLLRKGKCHLSVEAIEPSRLMFIPGSEFIQLCRRFPKLGNLLLRNLGEHLSKKLDDARFEADTLTEDTGDWERQ